MTERRPDRRVDSIGPDQQVSVNLARVRERDRDAARRLANTRNLRVAAYLRVTSVPQSAQELWTVHDCGRTSETRLERLRRDRRQWVPSIIEDAAEALCAVAIVPCVVGLFGVYSAMLEVFS